MDKEVVVTPEVSVSVDPSAPAAPQSASDEKPSWLDARLERERSKLLKDLGVASLDEAKKAIDELNAKREAEKSDAQKRGELESYLKTERAEKQALAEALNVYAKAQMASLSESQRNAVVAVAGDDPAKQLKTLEALRPTWASAPAAVVEPPKDTATKPSAPRDEGSNSAPVDPKDVYEELKRQNPILAARYALANGVFSK